eukprot:TRINITY_DN869_c1_g1_i5.p1 TRINITY_DN869_c1_g1~~TRINITY_DN869_c1_g1_i5.p1  ORF type:complete len:693 (-),score=160.75 TRINITY_DN869_c1_g1_i5:162-2240(-)
MMGICSFVYIFLVLVSVCFGHVEWEHLEWAKTNKQKHSALSPSAVKIEGEQFSGSFNVLIKDGDVDPVNDQQVLGQLYSQTGEKLFGNVTDGTRDSGWQLISHAPDYFSFLQVGDKIFSVVQFEFPMPSAIYIMELDQSDIGTLTVTGLRYINTTDVGGIWSPCGGSVSPWNTHLGGEEYPPNARYFREVNSFEEFLSKDRFIGTKVLYWMKFYGFYPKWVDIYNMRAHIKPYRYGYNFEVSVSPEGSTTVVKHFSMGRTSIELPRVMPDNKTVYITSDGVNKAFLRFVADVPGDLSAGTLYASKFKQLDATNGGKFAVTWVDLGHATDDELIGSSTTLEFDDIFEFRHPWIAKFPDNDGCDEEYTSINSNIAHECLKIKEGMELYASRFETERYAAMMGATTEFNKWEGITYSKYDNKIYSSISEIRHGMEDNAIKGVFNDQFDKGGYNDIRLDYNPCGCVYVLDLDDSYTVTAMNGFLCGEAYPPSPNAPVSDVDGAEVYNQCKIDKIANPDNIAAIDGHAGLIIAEDTNKHQNDILWYYDLQEDTMTRILSGPYGCEITGTYFYPNLNGFSYMTAVIQHPYGESDSSKALDEGAFGYNGAIGYYGPFPVVDPTRLIANATPAFKKSSLATSTAVVGETFYLPVVEPEEEVVEVGPEEEAEEPGLEEEDEEDVLVSSVLDQILALHGDSD